MPTLKCDLCDTNPADFMIGLILTGDQTTCCVRCLPQFTEAVVKTLQSVEADTPQEQLSGPQEAPGAAVASWEDDYPQPAPEPPRSRKAPKSAPSATPAAQEAAADGE